MAKILTAASVSKLRPMKDLREIPDGQAVGLYLLIHPSNKKVWALRYRRPRDNRPAKLTLGTVFSADDGSEPDVNPVIGGHLSLAGARRLVGELKHEIALGRDPGAAHIAKKRNTSTTHDAFGSAARDFILGYRIRKTGKQPRRMEGTARMIGLQPMEDGTLNIIPGSLTARWRDIPISEIDEDMIYRVIDEARVKGVPGLQRRNTGESEPRARSLHSVLSVLFGWLKLKRRIKVDPTATLDAPTAPKARDRVLSDDEIKKLWSTCDDEGFPFGPIIKLLLLTGCRLNEIAGMKWSELDKGLTTLSLLGERTKNNEKHSVAISQLSKSIFEGIDRIPGCDLIFTTNGERPVSGWSKLKRRIDATMNIPDWRLHDLRRTAASGMQRIGVRVEVIERALNHISGSYSGVAGTYQRDPMVDDTRAALKKWADYIEDIIAGRKVGKVVPLRRGKS